MTLREIPKPETGPASIGALELSPWRLLIHSLRWQAQRLWRRLPRVVWVGDEIDVNIRLNGIGGLGMEPNHQELERLLSEAGITFDRGSGPDGRDWEWDWSLRGPIRISFRGRAKHPEQRVLQKPPQLRPVS